MPTARAHDLFVTEAPQYMAIGESRSFLIEFATIGTPTAVTSMLAYDATGTDKSVLVLSGASSIIGTVITTKLFTPASAQLYRLVVGCTILGNTVYGAVDVNCFSIIPALGVTNGYCTLAEIKQYAVPDGGSDALDDGIIGNLVNTASRYIDGYTGRTFYARAAETRYFSIPEDNLLMFDDDLISIDVDGFHNGNADHIAATEYNLLPKNTSPKYALELKDSASTIWSQDTNGNDDYVLSITGSWGYASTAPEDIKAACLMLAASLYKRRFGENLSATSTITAAGVLISPQDIPLATTLILNRYRRLV